MENVRRVAWYFAWVNVVIGLAGFSAPLVTGNNDRIVNIRPGQLLGLAAINWLHALLHLSFGLLGLTMARTARGGRVYMSITAALFGPLTLLGFFKGRGQTGIYMVMGMALDTGANIVHLTWSALGFVYGFADVVRESRLAGVLRL